jgi:hypothetical protein
VQRLKATNVTGINDGTLLCDHGQIQFRSYSRVGFNDAGGGSDGAGTAKTDGN